MSTETVLVVAPHPDDETFGCGGTLLKHREAGHSVHWLIMTTMTGSAGYSSERMASRAEEIRQVSAAYGMASVRQASFPTTELDVIPLKTLVQEVAATFANVLPNTVYLPFRHDAHSDHTAVFDAVAACTKSFRFPSVRRVRAYETLSETEFSLRPGASGFTPNLWVDISTHLERKIGILRIYGTELGQHPFPRSERNIRALASLRGSTAGCEAAEAFISLKEIA